jgi:hypothetical protein
MTYDFDGNQIELPAGWRIATLKDGPFTVVSAHDIGALQFSFARYMSGAKPGADHTTLESMLQEFADSHGLERCGEVAIATNGGSISVCADYRVEDDFVRAWYLTDGTSFALVTYLCSWGASRMEVRDACIIVESLRLARG